MGNVESEDSGLWSRSLKGDDEAFRVLYARHKDRAFRHAYRIAGDRHAAEDIMATTFLELWRLRSKVRLVEGSVLPWLLVTTTNVARNSGRAARRYRRLLDSLPRPDESATAKEDTYAFAQQVLDHDLASALGTLSTEDLHLVSLVVFEDYSLSDAAAALKLTPGAAKTRMHRAKQRMKNALSGTRIAPVTAVASEGEQA